MSGDEETRISSEARPTAEPQQPAPVSRCQPACAQDIDIDLTVASVPRAACMTEPQLAARNEHRFIHVPVTRPAHHGTPRRAVAILRLPAAHSSPGAALIWLPPRGAQCTARSDHMRQRA